MVTTKQERVLLILIACEIALFSVTATNFLSLNNLFECIRLSTEIGLLALALTPVIVTGGIDLSVGSLIGLCAVAFGFMSQDLQLPLPIAIVLTVVVSLLGGAINAILIARFKASPLIVTLGTFSLFRGLAEGVTAGAKSYSGFSPRFLYLGQGYLGGLVPTQTIVFVIAIVAFFLLLHRSTVGRALYAIGNSSEGARYAAIPVAKRLASVYLLSGLSAGLAGIIYVAHLGQAKSNAGTGYELIAITAVVLGGTSIFGGSGTIGGTLLGLAAIVLLQNGLLLSAWPEELAGILTGVLLILTIVLQRFWREEQEYIDSKNTKYRRLVYVRAILALSISTIALLLLVTTGYLGRNKNSQVAKQDGSTTEKRVTIAVMPKAKGDPYFVSCRAGAEEAAKDLNVNLIWDGPTGLDAAKQNEIVEGWITRKVDAISVSVENAPAISSVLRKARNQGIKVVTWDADAEPDARDYFINQATSQDIGYTLVDESARVINETGEVAIITGALTAANQNLWITFIKERLSKYPNMKLAVVRPSDDDRDKAFVEAKTITRVYPNVRIIIVISAPAVPGAAEAIKQAGRQDVQVIGLSLPNLCKPYVHGGQIEAVVLWSTNDLGYLAVTAPAALVRGTFGVDQSQVAAGRLGILRISGTEIILGPPLIFRKDNIDKFDF